MEDLDRQGHSMSTQPTHRYPRLISRFAALAISVITAIAIAAPIADASAATPRAVPQAAATAVGPTLIGNVFNGKLVIVTSSGGATVVAH
jgi:hypothetical protein